MDLSLQSWISLGIIGAALVVALSNRITAAGTLLVANILVFVVTEFAPARLAPLGAASGYIDPVNAVRGELGLFAPALLAGVPSSYMQAFTSMFVHGDFLHIFGNSLFLAFFGLPFEQRCGARRFVAIYVLTGLVAVVAEMIIIGNQPVIMMGASGAIFGILGAFASRYPRQIVAVPVPLPIMFIVRMPIILGAAIYAAFQLFYAYYSLQTGPDGVAYFAHLGGLLAGIALAPLLVPRKESSSRQRVDLDRFGPFAQTPAAASILDAMRKNNDEPAVFQAWLDRFLRVAQCPTCRSSIKPAAAGHVVCQQGHHFDVRHA